MDVIESLLEAARWAPSGGNSQPGRFVFASHGADGFGDIVQCLMEKNQWWAKDAAVLIVAIANMRNRRTGQPNRWAPYDLGQSIAHLTFEAESRGLRVHQMGGFDPVKLTETLAIPDDFEPFTVVAVGHQGRPEQLEESQKAMELDLVRRRLPLSEVAFEGKFSSK